MYIGLRCAAVPRQSTTSKFYFYFTCRYFQISNILNTKLLRFVIITLNYKDFFFLLFLITIIKNETQKYIITFKFKNIQSDYVCVLVLLPLITFCRLSTYKTIQIALSPVAQTFHDTIYIFIRLETIAIYQTNQTISWLITGVSVKLMRIYT